MKKTKKNTWRTFICPEVLVSRENSKGMKKELPKKLPVAQSRIKLKMNPSDPGDSLLADPSVGPNL